MMAVYFIRTESGPVKIGWAKNVDARLRGLQCCHYEELKVLRLIEGKRSIEGRLHNHFRDQHIRGEWFRYRPEMLTVLPHSAMENFREVIDAWPSTGAFGKDTGTSDSHARTMRSRDSIPAGLWAVVVESAATRGIPGVTLELLASFARARRGETTAPDQGEAA